MTSGKGLPPINHHSPSVAENLLSELDHLRTFSDVATWDLKAERHLAELDAALAAITDAEAQVDAAERVGLEEASQRSFLRRMMGPPAEVRAAREWKARATKERERLTDLSDRLQAAIDKTPNSREEQAEMLRELKLAKKELGIQKREAGEALRQIRVDARQQSAKIGATLGSALVGARGRRYQRMGIRLQKEAAVKPHETVKAHIERQILVIDRAIHWIERFK
jgi:hypothetical protein